MGNKILNIAAYLFVELSPERLATLKKELTCKCRTLGLKGTILLSAEGINLFLAGEKHDIESFWNSLISFQPFSGMQYKGSYSSKPPFKRLNVKIKSEIIPFDKNATAPSDFRGKRVAPSALKQWLDEGKDVTLIDTRNDFEVHLGSFNGATHLGISSFRSFPDAASRLSSDLKERPVVLFCTGGVRCEKAAPFLEQKGFRQVMQLDGGILKYFEECGGAHYSGDCFVFDNRIAVDEHLQESGAVLCEHCQFPVTRDEQQSGAYVSGKGCRHCRNH